MKMNEGHPRSQLLVLLLPHIIVTGTRRNEKGRIEILEL